MKSEVTYEFRIRLTLSPGYSRPLIEGMPSEMHLRGARAEVVAAALLIGYEEEARSKQDVEDTG